MEETQFIESGILEAHVLGISSVEEEKVLKEMVHKHPSIARELNEIELCVEKLALFFALPVPSEIKEKVENEIFSAEEEVEKVPDFLLTKNTRLQVFRWYAIAASVTTLLAAGFGIWGYQNLLESQTKLSQIKIDYQLLSAESQKLYNENKNMSSLSSYLSKEGALQVMLVSTRKDQSKATLFWNPNTSEVWLVGGNLPKLPEGQQYQMWGMVEGKPVDAGVFDAYSTGSMMVPMKPMQKPTMFAVTVEKQGGSVHPNMNTLCLKAEL